MNSIDKLFLLDAYALIYRAYYAFIKNPRINSKGFNTSELERVLSKSFLKSSNSSEIGDFINDELSMHRYLPTKIVIKRLIRYFFVLLP